MANLSLYVNGLGTESSGWTEVGDSPYLNALDQPTHYIYSATKKAEHGDFTFTDTQFQIIFFIPIIIWWACVWALLGLNSKD